MTKLCLFDSNGTLLDMAALDPVFAEIFGDKSFRKLWFQTVLHTTLVLTVVDDYQDLNRISEQTLAALAKEHKIELSQKQKLRFKEQMQNLPGFSDVIDGLNLLKASGYRLVVLTNAGKTLTALQLTRAGIADYFDDILSTDALKVFKPALGPYHAALKKFGVQADDAWFIAGHAWDITGAKKAGLKTALILREGHGMNNCFGEATIEAASLREIAERIMAKERTFFEKILHPFRRWFGANQPSKRLLQEEKATVTPRFLK